MDLVSMTAVEQRSVTVKCVALRRTESKKKKKNEKGGLYVLCIYVYIYMYIQYD